MHNWVMVGLRLWVFAIFLAVYNDTIDCCSIGAHPAPLNRTFGAWCGWRTLSTTRDEICDETALLPRVGQYDRRLSEGHLQNPVDILV